MSAFASIPSMIALWIVLSYVKMFTVDAPSITWKLVTTLPSLVKIAPEPWPLSVNTDTTDSNDSSTIFEKSVDRVSIEVISFSNSSFAFCIDSCDSV